MIQKVAIGYFGETLPVESFDNRSDNLAAGAVIELMGLLVVTPGLQGSMAVLAGKANQTTPDNGGLFRIVQFKFRELSNFLRIATHLVVVRSQFSKMLALEIALQIPGKNILSIEQCFIETLPGNLFTDALFCNQKTE